VEYNDELWRIIGTFDGSDVGLEEGKQYTKIIRSNPFSTAYPWDWDDINGNGLIDRDEWSELWADASLNALLNNDYLNQAGEFSSTSTDKGLNETARNMIAKFNNQYSKWYTKGYLTGNTQTANDFYSDERQKGYLYTAIGSMYPSDYGYAIYDGGNDDSCVFPSRANMSSCKQYNWLYRSGVNQLLISYGKMGSLLIPSMISSEGQVTMYDISTSTAYFRPALYLEADVLIISGKGSEDDPYKIYKKTKDSSSDTLSDTILALASGIERQSAQTNGGVYRVVSPEVTTPNFTIYKNLTQDEYGSVVEYKASESGALLSAGTLTSNIYTWDSSEGFWEKSYVRGNDGDYYNLVIPIKESGNYRYCFSTHYGSSSNKLKVYITDENSSIYANSKSTISLTSVVGNDCRGLGDITEGQGVRFEYMKGGASGTGVSITLQKMEETVPFGNPGVKYQGKDPNNYVLFNNGELWRIIGTFEGSTIGLEQGEHYTKIIKSASIGNYEWDSSISTTWQDSDLNYYLTNNLYNNLNVNTKDMIEYATWHLGKIQNGDYNASGYYIEERGASGGIIPHQNYIGLMNPSDYGYAMYAGNTNHDCTIETLISNYSASKYGCVNYDWLFNGDEWTISPINLRSSFIVSADGVIGIGGNDTDEYAVRPVLYLKSNVSIEAGEGTLSSPYILK